jgi:hypothetical protein
MDCPRKFFYEYVLGWRPVDPNVHLVFGSAWHTAMEVLLLAGYDVDAMAMAYLAAEMKYREAFPNEESDPTRIPKTPGYIKLALPMYTKQYADADRDMKVEYTEIAGTVPIGKDKLLYFKTDSMLHSLDRGHWSLEHKTGSQNSGPWRDGFSLKFQTFTYHHVLYCLYQDVWGVEINGAVFTKGKIAEFPRMPVRKTLPMLAAWLHLAEHYYDSIMKDYDLLLKQDADDEAMKCFWQNTEACSSYSGCVYKDFCVSWPNPLQRCHELPVGFKVEFWDPREMVKDAKKVINF